MKNIAISWIIIAVAVAPASAQEYFTKNGHIAFFSKTVFEDISAFHNQVISILNVQTGEIRFSLLNKAFHFPKAKMEEDFNDEYIESDRYPRSTFAGSVDHITEINFAKDGSWPVVVTGDLLIHGVIKRITIPGTLTVKSGQISVSSSFRILPEDYHIKIPSILSYKVAKSIDVTVECLYQKK